MDRKACKQLPHPGLPQVYTYNSFCHYTVQNYQTSVAKPTAALFDSQVSRNREDG